MRLAPSSCSAHPERVSGWRCPACAKELCVECAATTEHLIVVCAACGTLAAAHLAPRAEVFPFRGLWPSTLRQLGSLHGLVQAVVAATAAHVLFTLGKAFWVVGWVVTASWVLGIARRTALGLDPYGWPSWHDQQVVATGSLLRFSCGAGAVGLAAMLWTRLGLEARSLASAWPWLIAVAAVALIPPALVVSSVEGAGREIPWPWHAGRWLRLLGADLRPLQLAALAVVAVELFESQLAPADRELEDTRMLQHLAASWAPRLVSFGALAALGALAGALVFTRAGALGHRRPEEDLVPRVTEPPTGRYVPPPPDLRAEEEALARKFAPIELGQVLGPSAIERGAKEEALAAYRAGELLATQLEPAPAIFLAQWLAGGGDFVAAANLLRVVTATTVGAAPALARAMVVLARLCAERLGAQTEAVRLYTEVTQRFPGTPAAAFAAAQLAPRP